MKLDRFDDPRYVREQYATEDGLEARRSIYRDTTGPGARELMFAAVAEIDPGRVLEVGRGPGEAAFGRENGADLLRRHFELVERRDADGTVTLHSADDVRTYLSSSARARPFVDAVPDLDEPLVVRRRPTVFVAERAA